MENYKNKIKKKRKKKKKKKKKKNACNSLPLYEHTANTSNQAA